MIASRRALSGLALLGLLVTVIACSGTERSFATVEDSGAGADDDLPPNDDGGKIQRGDSGVPDDNPPGDDAGAAPADGGLDMSCAKTSDCDDGNSCNGEELCKANLCVAGKAVDDGAACVLGASKDKHFCVDGNCAPSRCGDKVVDKAADEVCDDGNQELGDGCEPDCKFSCAGNTDCDDSNVCNGDEVCDDATHVCVAGEDLPNTTSCGDMRECNGGRCAPVGCGNGVVSSKEQCDDMNAVENDGCRTDCTYTCEKDEQCDDANACNGAETCDLVTHTCKAGTDIVCDAKTACVQSACNPLSGKCVSRLIDDDIDGHASDKLGPCGTDCNDKDPTIFNGAEELCDQKDNNCNRDVDETAPTWYLDCDGDGFASDKAQSVRQCGQPAPAIGSCLKGQAATWVTLAPGPGTADCWDLNSAVHPMGAAENDLAWSTQDIVGRTTAVDFDYNCDYEEERRYTSLASVDDSCGFVIDPRAEPSFGTQGLVIGFCPGAAGYTSRVAPVCGQPATYTYCLSSCKRTSESRVQQCR